MKTFPSRTSLFCLFLALCLAAAESAAAQSYKAEALSEPPPSELAAPVRNAVSGTGIRVTGPSGALCDIWLGKAVPGKANAPQSLTEVSPLPASAHRKNAYAVFCLKQKIPKDNTQQCT